MTGRVVSVPETAFFSKEFPVQLDKIDKFEKNNLNDGINVYGYENEKVHPLCIFKNESREHIFKEKITISFQNFQAQDSYVDVEQIIGDMFLL